MRRTPLKRAAFKSHVPQQVDRAERLERRAAAILAGASPRHAIMAPTWPHRSAPKEPAPLRSEAYRRAVASLPCINCGVPGYSQCAHSNSGKGAGIKASDLDSFPLCTVHPGADGRLVQGCHENFDQGAMFTKAVRRELEPVWAADTQRRILAMGLWPKALPLKNFSTGDDFELTRKNRT